MQARVACLNEGHVIVLRCLDRLVTASHFRSQKPHNRRRNGLKQNVFALEAWNPAGRYAWVPAVMSPCIPSAVIVFFQRRPRCKSMPLRALLPGHDCCARCAEWACPSPVDYRPGCATRPRRRRELFKSSEHCKAWCLVACKLRCKH